MDRGRFLRLFEVTKDSSPARLEKKFKELVKKYHPDSNPDHQQWATERMQEINQAFEFVHGHVSSGAHLAPDSVVIPPVDLASANFPRKEEPLHTFLPPLPLSLREVTLDIFLQGMGLYYQYGLENQSLRSEGIRRIRYHSALTLVKKGSHALARANPDKLLQRDQQASLLAHRQFAHLFLENMTCSQLQQQKIIEYEGAGPLYYRGCLLLDQIIKLAFFPHYIEKHRIKRVLDSITPCHANFVAILTNHAHSHVAEEAARKLKLLKVLLSLPLTTLSPPQEKRRRRTL